LATPPTGRVKTHPQEFGWCFREALWPKLTNNYSMREEIQGCGEKNDEGERKERRKTFMHILL
jgi:hypothetical protein